MKSVGTWALVLVIAVVGGSLLSTLGPIKQMYDSLFNRETVVATDDVVLKRLKEQKMLVAATGTFQVPVVVCNGNPEAYDPDEGPDEDGATPAQRLLEACDGLLESRATVLVNSEVDAVIDLGSLKKEDVVVSGDRVTIKLPAIQLGEPRVDAEDGIVVIDKDGSVPLIGGDLPEDYQARAAGEAKGAVSRLAGRSGLPDLGTRSATNLFESLLVAPGVRDVKVVFQPSEADER